MSMAHNVGKSEPGDTNELRIISRQRHHTFDVLCGTPVLAGSFVNKLASEGFSYDKTAPIKLVIDVQRGFALDILETLDRAKLKLIVVTFSFCPEYWEDLSDLHPDILIVDDKYEHDFGRAIESAARGEQYKLAPHRKSVLTPNERVVLRGVARGWTNKQIADSIHVQAKTVTNALTDIYRKLGLTSRTQALLYYWGLWRNINAVDVAPKSASPIERQYGDIPPLKRG